MTTVNGELADFLRRARSKVDPATAGLPHDGRIRRVPGLRREEVALLAGVSTDYYTRLEQGRRITPSDSVLDAIARALGLDETGRAHLGHLVGAPAGSARRHKPTVQRVRPGLHQLLDTLVGHPALILGRRTDVLASNRLARALFADFNAMRPTERNYARWMFLSDQARALFVDWEEHARACVENLRLDLGTYPADELALGLIAELTEQSPEFRAWWEEHGVFQRTFGTKRLRHPVVGELAVQYETFTMPGDRDQALFLYTTEAGTSSREAMGLLASWVLAETGRPQPSAPDSEG
ncbi:helix-turn-helix transcriptional regulator [Glycomyces sp. TRM65418]|uniref:helix-turn-helix domain-containing protein n=1 Tax=Glycomyces sp. TRM65418 TaxID=2867006 RepID=UPI001CE5AB13|nr:helix-turn-helix transcriptional regulator [Glycomyces sp. TRM65418]MCC3761574.1 helix-turn-helix transcriptional regulator [Glycomyces sp. TRM65418]QZD55669.1 helix-turn-helix transcriptional regulator [Glycomyces sp. TRM65418]